METELQICDVEGSIAILIVKSILPWKRLVGVLYSKASDLTCVLIQGISLSFQKARINFWTQIASVSRIQMAEDCAHQRNEYWIRCSVLLEKWLPF